MEYRASGDWEWNRADLDFADVDDRTVAAVHLVDTFHIEEEDNLVEGTSRVPFQEEASRDRAGSSAGTEMEAEDQAGIRGRCRAE